MNTLGTWFNGLRGKLLVTAILPLVGFSTIAYFSLSGIRQLSGLLSESYTNALPSTRTLGEMNTALNSIARWAWSGHVVYGEPGANAKTVENIRNSIEKFNKAQKIYEATPSTETERALYKGVQESWPNVVEELNVIISLFDKGTNEANSQVKDHIMKKYRAVSLKIEKSLDDIIELYNKNAAESEKVAAEAQQKVLTLVLTISSIASIGIFALVLVIAIRLARAVGQIADRLSHSAAQVSTSSQQLSGAGQELSAATAEAAASLEETVSSLEELSSMVKLNADNAKEAANLSQNSKSAAEAGESEIMNLIKSMTEISESSKKIEEIINVIDDIAFQTNLLALNAAVEAARAGEQGKGFAVVAEAVRTLAQRSAAAAKDITTLIKESVSQIDHGTTVADKSGSVLKNIVISVKKVADLNTEIASASQEQSSGIAQISQAMNQLDQATQTNASSAEEVAASSEEMSGQSESLNNLVNELTIIVNGKLEQRDGMMAHPVRHTDIHFNSTSPQPRGSTKLQMVSNHSKKETQSSKKMEAENIIPLGNEVRTAKVGTTDGF